MNKGFIKFWIVAVIAFVISLGVLATVNAYAHTIKLDKVALCHKTSSLTNPFVVQLVNANEVQSHLGNGDFLYEGSFKVNTLAARAWCKDHQTEVSPTPTATATPTMTPVPSCEPKDIWKDRNEDDCNTGGSPTPTPTVNPCEGNLEVTVDFVQKDCLTPTPTATPEASPTPTEQVSNNSSTGGTSTAQAPVCPDGNTVKLPANPFVVRQGSNATVNFFITEGEQANIYWRVVDSPDWQNAVSGIKPNGDNFVSFTIHDLNPQLGYDFGIQQVQGCGGGQLVTAVIVDGPQAKTFTFSFWEWSK